MAGKAYLKVLVKKIPAGILTLFGLSVFVFLLTRVVPTDPVRVALGPGASEDAVAEYRTEMGLDEPIPVQYLTWFTDVLQGDLGESLRTQQPVVTDLVTRAPATFELVGVALVFSILLGVPLGVISGLKKDQLPDHGSRAVALSGIAFPRFWVAIILQIVLVTWLSLFPLRGRISGAPPQHITGMYTVDSLLTLNISAFFDTLSHLILPAIALGFSTLAQIARLVRSEMIEVRRENYTEAAFALGLPSQLIAYKYMLKNAFSSSITVVGFQIGGMIAGSTLVELIYDINGIGRYAVFAIVDVDYNAIIGVILLLGTVYVISNALVDVLYTYLDPRVRHGGDS